MVSRITSTGFPKPGASSCIPPESVRIRWLAAKEVVKVENFKRVDDVQPIETVELGVSSRTNSRIHMYRIDGLGIGVLLHHATYGAKHSVHRLAQILATMRGYQYQA